MANDQNDEHTFMCRRSEAIAHIRAAMRCMPKEDFQGTPVETLMELAMNGADCTATKQDATNLYETLECVLCEINAREEDIALGSPRIRNIAAIRSLVSKALEKADDMINAKEYV